MNVKLKKPGTTYTSQYGDTGEYGDVIRIEEAEYAATPDLFEPIDAQHETMNAEDSDPLDADARIYG